MLRGLFDGYQEGAGKGAWVLCRVGLSPRGMGSEITHTPISLPTPNILCQTFRMRNLTATLCLTIAVLLGSTGCSQPLVGGDRDEHGCIGSAGYIWSAEKQQCIRPWERK